MKLDKKERLMLSLQFKILESLYPEDKQYYNKHRIAIEDGYELHYDWIVEHLSEGLTNDECKFVLDVLDMYSSFYFSFSNLNEPIKLTIDAIKFHGFDGNNEIMFMSYTNYFIEDLNRYDELKETTKCDYNSHIRMIPKYKNMLNKWKEFQISYRHSLTEDQIFELINIHE
jgi:uncharacterized protein